MAEIFDIAIRGGRCFVSGKFLECNIGINGNKIEYIGKKEIEGEIGIDARPNLVLPGFFNAHTHAAMTLLRGYAEGLPLKEWLHKIWEVEKRLKEKDVYWGTMLACLEMVKSGITCFVDMYIHMDGVAKAVGDVGLRAILGYGMVDRGDEELAEKELKVALEFISNWRDKNGITCIFAPHAPYTCSPEFLREVSKLSDELGVMKHIHVSETAWEVREVKEKYGYRPVELLHEIGFLDDRTTIAHAIWLNDRELDLLVKDRVSVVHCPSSNMKLSSGIARVAEMLERGINVCLGTDGAASNNTLNIIFEMRVASLLQRLRGKFVSSIDLLKMATSNGYRAFDLPGGSLEEGKLADIVIVKKNLSYNPVYKLEDSIVHASLGCEVDTVIIDGNLILDGGNIITIDEERVLSNIENRLSSIFNKY